jgi:hypothetical protein
MKTKRFLPILSFTLLLFVLFHIDVKADEATWRQTDNRSSGNSSVSIFVFIEENSLRISSINEWDQVSIQVLDESNATVYEGVIYLPEGEEITIPIGEIPDGMYQVILTKYNIPIAWYLIK